MPLNENTVLILSHPSTRDKSLSFLQDIHLHITKGDETLSDQLPQQTTVRLSTKYYTARVSLVLCDQLDNDTTHGQALIMLYDDVDSMEHAKEQVMLNKSLVEEVFETKVMVYCGVDDEQHRKQVMDSLMTWCLDHGFEQTYHISLQDDRAATSDGEKEQTEGSLLQEKEGVGRIVEALECTMWPHMDVNEERRAVVKRTLTALEEETDDVDKEKEEDMGSVNDNDNDDDDDDDDGQLESKVELKEEVSVDGGETAEQMLQSVLFSLVSGEGETENVEGEPEHKQIEEFDQLLSGMMKLKRERNAMDRDVLKERAAEYAMKMMEMLGLDDEDDEDVDESEEDV